MGSLTSRPKVTAAAAPQTVYVPVAQYVAPATVAATVPDTTTTATAASTDTTTPTTDQTASTGRQAGLLERSRGALSTVLTSFRGILDDSVTPSPRKTLLGE